MSPLQRDLYIAVLGVGELPEAVEIAEGIRLLPVQKRPSVFDIARVNLSHTPRILASLAIDRYLRMEIEVKSDQVVKGGLNPLNLGWVLTALIRLKGYGFLHCPLLSDEPFNELSEINERRVSITVLEGPVFLESHPGHNKRQLNSETIAWIRKYFNYAHELAVQYGGFNLALQCSSSWLFAKDWGAALDKIWLGLEPMLSTAGLRSVDIIEMRKLDNIRLKAQNGLTIKEKELRAATYKAYELLRDRLLCLIEDDETK